MHSCCLHQCGEFNCFFGSFANFCAIKCFGFIIANRRFPFDIKNPIGYGIAMAIEGFVGLTGLIVISGVVSLAIDCFVYVTSATKDMLRMLDDVHKNAEIKEGRPRIFKQLCEFVEFHSELRQLRN